MINFLYAKVLAPSLHRPLGRLAQVSPRCSIYTRNLNGLQPILKEKTLLF
jgi:hypothetical protein